MKKLTDMAMYGYFDDFDVYISYDLIKEPMTKLLSSYSYMNFLFTDCTVQKAHFAFGKMKFTERGLILMDEFFKKKYKK